MIPVCLKLAITQRQLRTTEEIEGTTWRRGPKGSHLDCPLLGQNPNTAHDDNAQRTVVLEIRSRIQQGESEERERPAEPEASDWLTQARKIAIGFSTKR